jgi:3-oxoacyl-[acyl-carrier-protein] synthase II
MHVVGIGAVSGYGWGVPPLFAGLASGESAVVLHENLAGYVDDGRGYLALIDPAGGDPADGTSRHTQATRYAGREAVHDALGRGWEPGDNVAVLQVNILDTESWAAFYKIPTPKPRVRPKTWVNLMPSTAPQAFSKEFGFHGPAMTLSAQCASSNMALVVAKQWLDAGLASDVVILCADLSGLGDNLRGFVDTKVAVVDTPPFAGCQPYQAGGKGFVGGEAAVTMVLSPDPTGAYASVLGGAATADAFAPITINPNGIQLKRAFCEALENSGVAASEVAYFNGHGSGTRACDVAELALFDKLFPEAAGIFSFKPLLGHCQTAAAALEVLATIYSFETGVIPAPPQVSPPHPRAVFGPTPAQPGLVVKSSIGMGGYNTAVLIENPKER